ncbi:hypothetical protein Vafri_4625 [Volvox africanus]|uniref:Uncharacterized protein n=1 Tax=Volvox africanus TaxID=51714 RepID=A0A8J4EWF9_9CHLO|nr:hypothetical protein Vafri_4625 [Volvox africanus]
MQLLHKRRSALLASVWAAVHNAACPRAKGFDAVSDKIALNSPWGFHGAAEPSDAGALCAEDTICVSFDTLGVRHFVDVGNFVDSVGACTYIKQACPRANGYKALLRKMWSLTADANKNGSAAAMSHESELAARSHCNVTISCLAWTSLGEALMLPFVTTEADAIAAYDNAGAAQGISIVHSQRDVCLYLKEPCPAKYGYNTFAGKDFISSTAFRGVKKDKMSSAEMAESFCKVNPKCTAWNTKGEYAIGAVQGYETESNVCTYVKQPCPAIPGFTAHDSFTYPKSAPREHYNKTSFVEIVTHCTSNPHCAAFDTLRQIWPPAVAEAAPSVPFPGMCTFVKMPGLR